MTTKTFEEEVLSVTRKLQGLINSGFVIKDNIGKPITSAHQAAIKLVNSALTVYTIIMPDDHKCCCIKWSNMAIKLIKPYIKNKFFIEQWSSNSHYMLVDSSIIEQLQQLQPIDDIKVVDTFDLEFTKSTLPTYTNRASLFTVNTAPVLTPKELNKVLSLSERILVNQNNYFLLSNSITHTYNAPMTIIRLLGENVVSLNALNLLELILTYATNSSAVFGNKTDELKPFIIRYDFFNNNDFELKQSIDDVLSALSELRAITLINSYKYNFELEAFEIVSNVISKSIKQYSYTQPVGYYKSFKLHQQDYCYTFINYLQYVLNVKYTTTSKVADNVEDEKTTKVKQLKICLSSLLYNLELDEYIHDHNRIAQVLSNLYQAGLKAFLLKQISFEFNSRAVKDMIAHKDKLHEYFVLDIDQNSKRQFEKCKDIVTLINLDISSAKCRTNIVRR